MEDYKKRMVLEYAYIKEKYNKLHKLLIKYDAETLDFDLNCPPSLLKEQKRVMGEYLKILEIRAEIEGVNLESGVV